MDFIVKTLREGTKKIISCHSALGRKVDKGEFASDSHPEREILFVLKGNSEFMLADHCFQGEAGTAFLIDKWVTHSFGYREKDRNLCHMWLHLARQYIYGSILSIDQNGNKTIHRRTPNISPAVYDHIAARWDLLEKEKDISSEKVEEYLKGPVNMLLDEFLFQTEHPREDTGRVIDVTVESIRGHIIMSKGRNCSLRELEQLSGFNRYYLAHKFLQLTGKTIGECIEEIRIEYTATALQEGMKQKEIASELGFNTPANFWAWLQKHKKAVDRKKDSLSRKN